MSDPVSVAGSAVGVISLGIQVCQQIVSYCQSWRGYDQDIQKVASKADGLRTPLKKLREMIEKCSDNRSGNRERSREENVGHSAAGQQAEGHSRSIQTRLLVE